MDSLLAEAKVIALGDVVGVEPACTEVALAA